MTLGEAEQNKRHVKLCKYRRWHSIHARLVWGPRARPYPIDSAARPAVVAHGKCSSFSFAFQLRLFSQRVHIPFAIAHHIVFKHGFERCLCFVLGAIRFKIAGAQIVMPSQLVRLDAVRVRAVTLVILKVLAYGRDKHHVSRDAGRLCTFYVHQPYHSRVSCGT